MVSGNILASAHDVVGYLQPRGRVSSPSSFAIFWHTFVISIFLLSLSLSKINKLMSVVTIQRGHFMNSVLVNPGIYSCAVDAFLEISMHLFLPYVSNLLIRMSLQTSF